jgi:hypothetical protein
MSTFLITLVLFTAQPVEANKSSVPTGLEAARDSVITTQEQEERKSTATVRQGKELETAARDALRRWAKVDKAGAKTAAKEFIAIFNELKQDSSLGHSTRSQLSSQVRGRLIRLAELIPKNNTSKHENDVPPTGGNLQNAPQALGQLGGINPAGGLGNRGGPRGGFGGNAGNNLPPDTGEDLVDLIQKTIAPASWDVNGGPGTIRYWRPGHALVIRASDDVHEQIGGLLGQMH